MALDVEELRHLQSIAKRPRVMDLISSEIRTLEKKVPFFCISTLLFSNQHLLFNIYYIHMSLTWVTKFLPKYDCFGNVPNYLCEISFLLHDPQKKKQMLERDFSVQFVGNADWCIV